jgi:DNA-binding HxlR family transcriptional regulator
MSREKIIKRKIEELKEKFPDIDEKTLERELIPLEEKEIGVKTKKKKI